MNFREVIERYGYPVVSKEQAQYIEEVRNSSSERRKDIRLNGTLMPDGSRSRFGRLSGKWKYLLNAPFKISARCCDVLKKAPFKNYESRTRSWPMTGEMASESRRREINYLMYGCNGFTLKRPKSNPISFWLERDILRYLRDRDVPYSSIYGDIAETSSGLITTGADRTGCMFCMFGVHLDRGENRFMRMRRTHPKLWDYCIHTLGLGRILNYMGVPYSSIFDGIEEG
jgi:3'-phosphoadenosine 5'-phosphosulfate sulfotransferase (PAPS reductase)/FAD synthetase